MHRPSRIVATLLIATLCWALWPPRANAALIVEDPGAITQLVTTVSALMEIVGLNMQDLAGLANVAVVLEIANEVTILAGQLDSIADLVEARSQGWRGLMGRTPCKAAELQQWLYDATAWNRDGVNEALFAMGLIQRSAAVMHTVLRLVQAIETLIGGTTSGLQTVSAISTVTATELQKLHGLIVPYQQVMIGREVMEQMRTLSRRCMSANRWRTWGTFTRY